MKFFVILTRDCVSLIIRPIPNIQGFSCWMVNPTDISYHYMLLSVLHLKFLNKIHGIPSAKPVQAFLNISCVLSS